MTQCLEAYKGVRQGGPIQEICIDNFAIVIPQNITTHD
jgi:hypothetical protein